LAKKPSPPKQAPKRTAAEQARSTFDADPSPPSDAELADLIQQQRPIVETQRPPPSHCILSREEILARVPVTYPILIEMMKQGRFPRARKVGAKKLGWFEEEYLQWRANLPLQKWKGDDDET
jgi:prophage regulatory protein